MPDRPAGGIDGTGRRPTVVFRGQTPSAEAFPLEAAVAAAEADADLPVSTGRDAAA